MDPRKSITNDIKKYIRDIAARGNYVLLVGDTNEHLQQQNNDIKTLIDELNIDKIKLLKIEAEGYEPEVLEGLGDKMRICQYIAVDGGYERGIKSEQTLTIITNHLLNNGFEMMDIYFPWCRALFVNKKQNF